jgi:hypothetical protein
VNENTLEIYVQEIKLYRNEKDYSFFPLKEINAKTYIIDTTPLDET